MQLFISYAREDIEDVRDTVEILAAGGHAVWFDEQLLPGQDWKQELARAIERCQAFVYAVTRHALGSEWCEWELATAARLEKAVIPVLLEGGVAMPDTLQRLQYADFSSGQTPVAVARLMAALTAMQKLPLADSPTAPSDPKGLPSRAWGESAKHWTDIVVPEVHRPQDESEEIIGKFTANLIRGIEGVGGRMILTNQRLLFEAHRINVQTAPLAIPLASIQEVAATAALGIVPTGITIRCIGGEEHQFVAWGRKRIIAKIEEARKGIRASG